MIRYNRKEVSRIEKNKVIYIFPINGKNIDPTTVVSFGDEWEEFHSFDDTELDLIGDEYFDIVPDEVLRGAYALDVGCGSGRWTKYVSSKVKHVDAVDPSEAIYVADEVLKDVVNARLTQASVDTLPFDDESFDFVFSLGVLHHIPDTRQALIDSVKKLKKGGHFLVYLYYRLDNRGVLFKTLFHLSNSIRYIVSKMPRGLKTATCNILAVVLYMPFVLTSRLLVAIGAASVARAIPLNYYHDKSFYIIKNDALDRFGTPLEQRFSKKEITEMMKSAGLTDIVFSDQQPFWHAMGRKV